MPAADSREVGCHRMERGTAIRLVGLGTPRAQPQWRALRRFLRSAVTACPGSRPLLRWPHVRRVEAAADPQWKAEHGGRRTHSEGGERTRLAFFRAREEVRAVLANLRGTPALIGGLLFGSGLRLLEACRIRVKDLDIERRQVTIRAGKGNRDRMTLLPASLVVPLAAYGFSTSSLSFTLSGCSTSTPTGPRAR